MMSVSTRLGGNHGFYSPEGACENADLEKVTGKSGVEIKDPWLRSGLVFADADWKDNDKRNPLENILNAREIIGSRKSRGLDMRGTDLVVLSACESGIMWLVPKGLIPGGQR
jgi:hypothetical protein